MAEDPFVTSSTQQPHIYQPTPRRSFPRPIDTSDSPTHAFAPTTPPHLAASQSRPSDFLAQLNARLLRTTNYAQNGSLYEDSPTDGGAQAPSRNKSLLNMTQGTLFGIYDEDSGTAGEQSMAETPWGTGAETPGAKFPDASMGQNGLGSLDGGLAMKSMERRGTTNRHKTQSPRNKGQRRSPLWQSTVTTGKLAALCLFGMVYGIVVSHLHNTRELAAVKVESMDRQSWIYLASWGLFGIALGSTLPYVDVVWGGDPDETEESVKAEKEKEPETSVGEQLNDIVRSVGAFVGIAFAIRRLPWQSTLQLTFTLALVNPALWYILDRSKPGLSLSLIVTSILTSFIFLSNLDVLPSPSLPVTMNATHVSSPSSSVMGDELFAGVISYETLAMVTWVGSVLFCSCVCFGSIGRRLALWER